ncbi:MAG: Holliday junction branch migration protein RuvA [Ferruginibacter sp.]|nr:Holliday junction branch migration protein RuvA [Ferruginibacter sp.]
MYAYLLGKLTYKSPALVYLDVNGIGYEVNISLNTWSAIQHLEEVKLYTWLQVKEDAQNIYGFFDLAEKEMFLLLISVSGVGAATARMMLSYIRPDEVAVAIATGNSKMLESVKGIGKKTAERLVLELRDKTQKVSNWEMRKSSTVDNGLTWDALNALVALGISKPQAEQAIKKILVANPDIDQLEDLIKKALKAI